MPARMTRQEGVYWGKGKGGAVIKVSGKLKHATCGTDRYWHFNNHGDAAKPLVLVGSWADVATYLTSGHSKGIKNHLAHVTDTLGGGTKREPTSREIYAWAGPYSPGKVAREGIFPGQDVGATVINTAAGFGAGGARETLSGASDALKAVIDGAEGFSDFRDQVKGIFKSSKKGAKSGGVHHYAYIRFFYHDDTDGDGTLLGRNKIRFMETASTLLDLMAPHFSRA